MAYDAVNNRATFTPTASSSFSSVTSELFTVTLTSAMNDTYANPLDGNYAGAASNFVWTFGNTTDVLPPTASCNAITPNPFSPDGDGVLETATIGVVATDDTALRQVRCEISDLSNQTARTLVVLLAGKGPSTANLIWDGHDEQDVLVDNGTYQATCVAIDAAGNGSTTCTQQVAVNSALDPASFP